VAEWSEGTPAHPRRELTGERLCQLLTEHAPGRRVLGIGAHDGALTQAGFTVLEVADTAPANGSPPGRADAAICLDWNGRGRDADQRRLFTWIRRHLTERGVLVVDHVPSGDATSEAYDPVTGRRGGQRLYHPVQLVALVRAAGFAVERVEVGPPVPGGTPPACTVVARALPAPPRSLAVTSWGDPQDGVLLDLRYADDEAEWLRPEPAAVWAALLGSAHRNGADLIGHYLVDDPYGARRGAPVVSRHFDCPLAEDQVTFGAGVTSLLRDLSGLAHGGPILAPALVHPDLAAWAMAGGTEVCPVAEPATTAALLAAVAEVRPTLVHLDRPTFCAEVLGLDEVTAVARSAEAVGALVLIDESPAAYLRPSGSAVRLVGQVGNLVVLRGFTKAYSWGGLRCGFAVCSPGLADQVRELVTPMLVSTPALLAALRLLAAGDVFTRLRQRIRSVKPAFAARLTALGFAVTSGHKDIPWVTVGDGDGTVGRYLAKRGVRGLLPTPLPVGTDPARGPLHLTVPLSTGRMALFDQLVPTAVAAPT
jgi:histidinol-phosphate/aromatic aminotransferase/cobyric acid decarboxylase-like protein